MNKFYKGVLLTDLGNNFVPGTVTRDFMTALQWKERIESNKRRGGVTRHLRHGAACIIEIQYDKELLSHQEFQRAGVDEHSRLSCWTSIVQDKAQINESVNYRILNGDEIDKLYMTNGK